MAYTCDDCKYIFPSKRTSCPFCGGRVYNNTFLEQDLLDTGYTQVPVNNIDKNTQSNSSHPPYDDLRQAFFSSQSSSPTKDTIPNVSHQNLDTTSNNRESSPSDDDFFSQFSTKSNSSYSRDNIPTVETTYQTQQSEDQSQDDPYEQEMQEIERQRRRITRQYRWRAVRDFIANIRWRTVFRILFVIALVIIAIIIWQMRHVIFKSIFSFIISLLPIIIIVLGLWYIFRSLFR